MDFQHCTGDKKMVNVLSKTVKFILKIIIALFRRFPPLSALVMRVVAIFAVPMFWHFCELCRNASIGTAADKPTRRMWGICEAACFQFVQLQFTNLMD